MREWTRLPQPATSREALMGNKDKGGKHSKTAASRNLKEKRADKRAKKNPRDQGIITR